MKIRVTLLLTMLASWSFSQTQPLGPPISGVYMNCMDEIVDQAEGSPYNTQSNMDPFNWYMNLFDDALVQYMPDYDLVNIFCPPGGMPQNRINSRLNIAYNWYSGLEAHLGQYTDYGYEGLEIAMVVYNSSNFPITKTNDFFIDPSGPSIPADLPGGLGSLIDNLDLNFNCSSLGNAEQSLLRAADSTDLVLTINEINEILNPGPQATISQIVLSEVGKRAARVLFSRYRLSRNDTVARINYLALHPMAIKIDALIIEHEYWRPNSPGSPTWNEHRDMLVLLRNLICNGNRDMLLEDYVVLANPSSQGYSSPPPSKSQQAEFINIFADVINVSAMGENTYASLDRSCRDLEIYGQLARPCLFRPISNFWSNGAYNGAATNDWNCDRTFSGTHSGDDPGFYYEISANNGDWKTFENDFKLDFIAHNSGVGSPALSNCPNFTAPGVIMVGYVWNSASELLMSGFDVVYPRIKNTDLSNIELIYDVERKTLVIVDQNCNNGYLEIYNILGEQIFAEKWAPSSNFLQFPKMTAGTYVLRYISQIGHVKSEKIVVW